jgi:hypothetical protein
MNSLLDDKGKGPRRRGRCRAFGQPWAQPSRCGISAADRTLPGGLAAPIIGMAAPPHRSAAIDWPAVAAVLPRWLVPSLLNSVGRGTTSVAFRTRRSVGRQRPVGPPLPTSASSEARTSWPFRAQTPSRGPRGPAHTVLATLNRSLRRHFNRARASQQPIRSRRPNGWAGRVPVVASCGSALHSAVPESCRRRRPSSRDYKSRQSAI